MAQHVSCFKVARNDQNNQRIWWCHVTQVCVRRSQRARRHNLTQRALQAVRGATRVLSKRRFGHEGKRNSQPSGRRCVVQHVSCQIGVVTKQWGRCVVHHVSPSKNKARHNRRCKVQLVSCIEVNLRYGRCVVQHDSRLGGAKCNTSCLVYIGQVKDKLTNSNI